MKVKLSSAIAVIIVFQGTPLLAYVGPGAGITMLGALWAVLSAIVLAIGALLYWPVRAFLRKRKKMVSSEEDKVPENLEAEGN